MRLLAAIACVILAAACGKKGNPLPPLRPVPARIADLTAVRTADRVTLRFTIPAVNADGTEPAVIDRVDLYRLVLPPGAAAPGAAPAASATPAIPVPAAAAVSSGAPASGQPAVGTGASTAAQPAGSATAPAGAQPPVGAAAPAGAPAAPAGAAAPVPGTPTAPAAARAPTAASVIADQSNLLTRIAVRRAPPKVDEADAQAKPAKAPPPNVPADTRPESGTATTYVDLVDATAVAGSTRYYVAVPVVGATGRGRPGAASVLVAVTIGDLPAPPADVALTFDETRVIARWTPVAGDTFTVLRGTPGVAPAEVLTPEPIAAAEYSLPMTFGTPVCLAVRATHVTGAVQAEGASSAPVCVTPVDRFPPPAPTGLQAVQDGDAVTLIWTHVDAADLGGYIVLRGDGTTGALQPLMRAPIAAVTYRDTTVQAGQTYTYAVYAVDASPAANVSELSDRQTVILR